MIAFDVCALLVVRERKKSKKGDRGLGDWHFAGEAGVAWMVDVILCLWPTVCKSKNLHNGIVMMVHHGELARNGKR